MHEIHFCGMRVSLCTANIFRAATDKKNRLRYAANGSAALLTLNRILPQATWRALIEKMFLKPTRRRSE